MFLAIIKKKNTDSNSIWEKCGNFETHMESDVRKPN